VFHPEKTGRVMAENGRVLLKKDRASTLPKVENALEVL
jgi:hypothetical protein